MNTFAHPLLNVGVESLHLNRKSLEAVYLPETPNQLIKFGLGQTEYNQPSYSIESYNEISGQDLDTTSYVERVILDRLYMSTEDAFNKIKELDTLVDSFACNGGVSTESYDQLAALGLALEADLPNRSDYSEDYSGQNLTVTLEAVERKKGALGTVMYYSGLSAIGTFLGWIMGKFWSFITACGEYISSAYKRITKKKDKLKPHMDKPIPEEKKEKAVNLVRPKGYKQGNKSKSSPAENGLNRVDDLFNAHCYKLHQDNETVGVILYQQALSPKGKEVIGRVENMAKHSAHYADMVSNVLKSGDAASYNKDKLESISSSSNDINPEKTKSLVAAAQDDIKPTNESVNVNNKNATSTMIDYSNKLFDALVAWSKNPNKAKYDQLQKYVKHTKDYLKVQSNKQKSKTRDPDALKALSKLLTDAAGALSILNQHQMKHYRLVKTSVDLQEKAIDHILEFVGDYESDK